MSYFGSLVDQFGNPIGVQYPFSVDGDSVYVKDIDITRSTKVGWTGNIIDLFASPHVGAGIYNDSATNPKVIYIAFNRTLYLNAIGLGCRLANKYFSNIKLEFVGSDGTVRSISDDSANNTKYGTRAYDFTPVVCVGIIISVCTANTDVGLTNITIQKETSVIARLRGINPANEVDDVSINYGGSLYTSNVDNLGFESYNTLTGEIRVIEPIRLVGANFEGTTIDSKFWMSGATGTGASIAQSGGELIITSGTSNGAAVYGYTVRRSRYVSGSSMRYRGVGLLSGTGVVGNKRRWGVGWGASMPTITDGAWFQLDGTEFSVVTCKGGVETKVTSANFNGYLGNYTPGIICRTAEIYYNNKSVVFVVDGLTLHTVSASIDTWTSTLSLHAFGDSLNTGAIGASVTLKIRTASVYRMGKFETQPIYYHLFGNAATHVLKLGGGILHKIVYNNTSGTSLSIVDNITGTTPGIGIITTTSACLGVWDYELPFNTGLILITVGNGLDATIVYE